MSIQLISVSHKNAGLEVRSRFSLTPDQQKELTRAICQDSPATECVVLSTCNRMEIYMYGPDNATRDIFRKGQECLMRVLSLDKTMDAGKYLLFYQKEKAARHLFYVACGLDSMIVGEDQILGQVKEAHRRAMEEGATGTFLNTLFRYAITAAKKVKTRTDLSKTPVSTATIAVKAAREYLGSLKDKKILIIGASGKIGSTVLKNLLSEDEAKIWVSVRQRMTHIDRKYVFQTIDYRDRYKVLPDMDVIISATSSPHYTITADQAARHVDGGKKRVFIDLAVPQDIEESVKDIPGTGYYNIDDFARIARKNNDRKAAEAVAAQDILKEYQTDFEKWMLFQQAFEDVRTVKARVVEEAGEKGVEKAIDHFFFRLRNTATPEELSRFMDMIGRMAG